MTLRSRFVLAGITAALILGGIAGAAAPSSAASPGAPEGALVAGAEYTCALTPDRAADCWGNNDWGQAVDQPGPYTQLTASGFHTCGLTPAGAVDCWGNNVYGQAVDQPGPFGLSDGGCGTVESAQADVAAERDVVAGVVDTAREQRVLNQIDRLLARADTQLQAGAGRKGIVAYRQAVPLALSITPDGRALADALATVGCALATAEVDAAVVTTSGDQNLVNQANRLISQGEQLQADDYAAPAMRLYFLAFARVDPLT